MANTHVKTRSTLLITRDMQIKTAVRYHPTPIKMVITEKSTSNKCWRGSGEKGTLLHCWWECKLVQPPWKTVWRFLKKLKVELPYDPAIPLLGMYPDKTVIRKILAPLCSQHHYSQQQRHENNIKVHQQIRMDKEDVVSVCVCIYTCVCIYI